MKRTLILAVVILLAEVLPIQAAPVPPEPVFDTNSMDTNGLAMTYTVYVPLVMDNPLVEEQLFRLWAPD